MVLFIAVLLPLATLQLTSAAALHTRSSSRHKRDADVSKVDLDALKENLASIENGLSDFQKRSCAVGLNSHHCIFAHLDDMMTSSDYLKGGYSPGKRNAQLPSDIQTRAETLLHNLSEQKNAVATLRTLLNQFAAPRQTQKRTCAFRLGNHCLTEELDRAASQYYYLQSPHSPGRRRR